MITDILSLGRFHFFGFKRGAVAAKADGLATKPAAKAAGNRPEKDADYIQSESFYWGIYPYY